MFVSKRFLDGSLTAFCSLLSLPLVVYLFASDVPARATAGGPGADYRCASTPGPFWSMLECSCPIFNTPSDFCSNRMPTDGTDTIEFRYCDYDPGQSYSCDEVQLSCGDRIYNCVNAHCSDDTQTAKDDWGCALTDKPNGCGSETYTWCDPVVW